MAQKLGKRTGVIGECIWHTVFTKRGFMDLKYSVLGCFKVCFMVSIDPMCEVCCVVCDKIS